MDGNFRRRSGRNPYNPALVDIQHSSLPYSVPEVRHRYGPRIHILSHPTLMTILARVCSPNTHQPEMARLTGTLYHQMAMIVANAEFPRVVARIPTRMAAKHPKEGVYEGQVLDPATKVVCVDIARAGMMPSQTCFETFCSLVDYRNVRQDHIFMQRKTAKGRVTGADLSGSKVGGPIGGRLLVIPDPMAATGSSILECLEHYASLKIGTPRKIIAIHVIVTPEYIRRVHDADPDVIIYAVRLDRGLSPKAALAALPGERHDERGLNANQYIVPGGGGFGELLNNAED
jgi:uracil phosphoribosyltransferase